MFGFASTLSPHLSVHAKEPSKAAIVACTLVSVLNSSEEVCV